MKLVLLGTSYFIIRCLEGFKESGGHDVVLITLNDSVLPDNSYDISEYSTKNKIPCYKVDDINSEISQKLLNNLDFDLLFVSWPKILKKEILKIPKIGCIGTHPTYLPFNRGRHPVQWQIFLGIKKSALSFFWLDEGVDTGEVILKMDYSISEEDDINIVNKKINELGFEGCKILIDCLNSPRGRVCETAGNSWRKRDFHDCLIDPRMSANAIINLVKSFTKPYPCAKIITEENIINIVGARISEYDESIPISYIEPGKIISVADKFFLMKSYDLIIELESDIDLSAILNGDVYIYPPTKNIKKQIFFG